MPFRMDARVALPLDIEDDHIFFNDQAAIPPAIESPIRSIPDKNDLSLVQIPPI